MQACDRCRRRKSGCDKVHPSCGLCCKSGVACVYTDRTKEPMVRRDVVERLERRVRQTEATNRALTARLAAINAKSTPSDANSSSIQDSPRENDCRNVISDEISFLSLNAGGERQFLGSTSGVLLADLIRSAVEGDDDSLGGQLNTQRSGAALGSRLSARPTQVTISDKELPSCPPESVARTLHQAYFEHDHLCYPILDQSLVMANLGQIYAEPSVLERNPYEAFVFYMIVAISTSSVQNLERQSLPDAEIYQTQAILRLNNILASGGLKALQAILLLCQYQLTSSTHGTSTSLWHMVGMAVRMCFEMGLHREEAYKYRTNPNTPLGNDLEIRRRCFWCVLAMDRVVSITLGRPLAIHLEDVDLALPDCGNEQFSNSPQMDEMTLPKEQLQTAVFVHITRYRILCGTIMVSLHRSRHSSNESSALAAQTKLANELEEWRSRTNTLNLNSYSSHESHRSSFLTFDWYELLYYNARLMLYQPSPALPMTSSRALVAVPIIYGAAKQAISFYSHLHSLRRLNYTWITLHSVFMAGLSFVYAAGGHFRSKKTSHDQRQESAILKPDPSILDIVNVSRSCSNALVAVSERWKVPLYCHRVFDRLSDAVLKDAVDYHVSRGIATYPQPAPSPPVLDTPPPVIAPSHFTMDGPSPRSIQHAGASPLLALDNAFRDCFNDLQHFYESSFGEDPIGQLSQDWLGQIGGLQEIWSVNDS